ncbi:hypothetical protein VF21_00853 [Pseudogymnoascus sp. 05NY08]|nr:hypothetical protein VF21_00853 [Pseudogymnoascus sp. 05NY08]
MHFFTTSIALLVMPLAFAAPYDRFGTTYSEVGCPDSAKYGAVFETVCGNTGATK